jgi:ribosomal protein S6
MNLYEGMFLLDNDVVRADWQAAKSVVTDVLQKHGAEVVTARRWDERKLAYAIKTRQRGTYLLAYYNMGTEGIDGLRRELELSENVTRYMLLRADEVPAAEIEKGAAENEEGFVPPPPPEDDAPPEPEPEPVATRREEPKAAAATEEEKDAATEEKPAEDAAKPAEPAAEASADAAPAAEASAPSSDPEASADEAPEKKEEA